MFKSILSTILLLILCSACATGTELSESQTREIDAIIEQVSAAANMPSTVVVIDRGGKTIYQIALGEANLSHNVPTSTETAYGIGSITKSFTGLAIAQLVDSGKIDFKATVADYLPDYQGPGSAATVEQLLTHTSGIPNYVNEVPGIRLQLERNAFSREEMVALFENLPLNFSPGEKFSYSNSGYYLLGLIIETVTGKDYYSYLREAILDPLDMQRTYKGDLSQVIPNMARGYGMSAEGWVNAANWYYLVPFSAGSLVSTAGDVIRYRRGVFHSDAIPPAVRDTLLEKTTLNGGEESFYSLGGLVLSDFHGHGKVSHAGDIWGYTANHAYYPEDDLTIVQLSNLQINAPALSSVEAKIARVVLGIPAIQPTDLVLPAEELERYTGDFALHPYTIGFARLGFIASDGKLFMRFGGTGAGTSMVPLLAQGDGLFRVSFDDEWTIQFEGDGKTASRLVSDYLDGNLIAERTD